MSVNAINAADAPQQKKSNAGSAVAAGVGLGAAGGVAGYFIGNKRPDLEKVFTQSPDTFTSEAVKSADAASAKVLEDAVNEYKAAGDEAAVTTAAKNRGASIIGQNPDNITELDDAVRTAETSLSNKIVKIENADCKLADIQSELKTKADAHTQAKKAVKDAGANATDAQRQAVTDAKAELDKVIAKRKAFLEGAKTEVDALRTARKNRFDAQLAKFNAQAAVEGSAEKTIVTELEKAKTNLTNARNTKKTEILGRDAVKEAFEKIKSAIPKEGGKKMAMYIGIPAAVVGVLAGLMSGKKEA